MSVLIMLLWISNVALDSGGQLIFKAAAADPRAGEGMARWRWMLGKPLLWIGIAFYVVEFVLWLAFLSLVPLSDGVLLGSVSIVVVMLFGRILFGEKLTEMRVLGIMLVSLGVGIVGWQG